MFVPLVFSRLSMCVCGLMNCIRQCYTQHVHLVLRHCLFQTAMLTFPALFCKSFLDQTEMFLSFIFIIEFVLSQIHKQTNTHMHRKHSRTHKCTKNTNTHIHTNAQNTHKCTKKTHTHKAEGRQALGIHGNSTHTFKD